MNHSAFIAWRWIIACVVTITPALGHSEAAEQSFTNQFSQSEREQLQPVLKTAEQIHRLTREEAARAHRAVIRGVVTCALPDFGAVVIQDSTRGIYVDHLNPPLGELPPIGQMLEIEGVTDPGAFAPYIRA